MVHYWCVYGKWLMRSLKFSGSTQQFPRILKNKFMYISLIMSILLWFSRKHFIQNLDIVTITKFHGTYRRKIGTHFMSHLKKITPSSVSRALIKLSTTGSNVMYFNYIPPFQFPEPSCCDNIIQINTKNIQIRK